MEDKQWRDQVDAWDKAYKRKRKIIVLAILFLIVIGVAGYFCYPTVLDFFSQVPHYSKGKELLQAGQLEEAAEEFWKAGNFLDAEEYGGKLNYERAQAYLEEGRITYAAISFGKAGDYLDAREQSFALWERFADRTVRCASDLDIVGWIRPDGTVDFRYKKVNDSIAGDYNYPGNSSSWTDLVSIYISRGTTVGTFADGTVRYITGEKGTGGLKTYNPKWTDIILAYHTWNGHVIALKSDGTVCAECFYCGSRNCNLVKESAQWTDIIAICGKDILVGLKADGTLVTTSCPVDNAYLNTLYLNTLEYRALAQDLEAMTNVVAIRTQSLGNRYVMLLSDGTMRYLGADRVAGDTITPFDELVPPEPDSGAWFPARVETLAEPPRDRAAIAASFPDKISQAAQYYRQAVSLQEQGELAQAAIAFGKAGNYEDAASRSMVLWQQVGKLPTVAVRDGVVAALKEDGTVALADPEKQLGKNPANLNIKFIALYFCNQDLLGITPEGNVLVIGNQNEQLPATEHVVRAISTFDYGIVMQKTDGMLISEKGFMPAWSNVVVYDNFVALLANGGVRGAFDPPYWDEESSSFITDEPERIFTDIACATYVGGCYGVTPEGAVIQDEFRSSGSATPLWENAKYVYGSRYYLYGLLNNGHVVVASAESGKNAFGLEAADWTDIVSVSACDTCVAGLKKDGTLEFAGMSGLSKLKKEVQKMTGLMVPAV